VRSEDGGAESQPLDGTRPFNYTVKSTHDAGTDSNWVVSGKITVSNPNDWEDITANVTDTIPDGNCTVTGGTGVVIKAGESVTLDYSCTFTSNPGSGTNTVTWDKDAASTPNGSASATADFAFGAPTKVTDDCVTVDDTFNGGSTDTFGVACANGTFTKDAGNNLANFADLYSSGTRTFTFTYSRRVDAPENLGECDTYDNTATSTTDTGATDSDSETVTVCRFNAPLTIGYWKTHLAPNGTPGCTGFPNGTGCSKNGP
jgi:hypothetical protein